MGFSAATGAGLCPTLSVVCLQDRPIFRPRFDARHTFIPCRPSRPCGGG